MGGAGALTSASCALPLAAHTPFEPAAATFDDQHIVSCGSSNLGPITLKVVCPQSGHCTDCVGLGVPSSFPDGEVPSSGPMVRRSPGRSRGATPSACRSQFARRMGKTFPRSPIRARISRTS